VFVLASKEIKKCSHFFNLGGQIETRTERKHETERERERNKFVCVVRAINEDISFIFVFSVGTQYTPPAAEALGSFYQHFEKSKEELKKEISLSQKFLTCRKKRVKKTVFPSGVFSQ